MVIVDDPIVLGDKVKVVALNYGAVGGGIDAVITGWGMTKYPGSGSNILQVLKVKTITNKQCISDAPSSAQIIDAHLCTYTKVGEGACQV